MGALTATLLQFPSDLKPSLLIEGKTSSFLKKAMRIIPAKKNQSDVPVARLFGPAIFEASKLNVLFLGVDEKIHPENLPRTYTLTHCDITSKLTLAISRTINISQLEGWYSRLQRDEVVAEWKKIKGKMSLHVHCHISGSHFLLNLIASFRYYIFRKELPVVLRAFVHGDKNLFKNFPEMEQSLVWIYFNSNIPEFDKVECWGPLKKATSSGKSNEIQQMVDNVLGSNLYFPQPCQEACTCCSSPKSGSNNQCQGRLVRR